MEPGAEKGRKGGSGGKERTWDHWLLSDIDCRSRGKGRRRKMKRGEETTRVFIPGWEEKNRKSKKKNQANIKVR